MPGHDKGVHVGDGSAGSEDAVAVSEADDLAHLGEHLRDERATSFIRIRV